VSDNGRKRKCHCARNLPSRCFRTALRTRQPGRLAVSDERGGIVGTFPARGFLCDSFYSFEEHHARALLIRIVRHLLSAFKRLGELGSSLGLLSGCRSDRGVRANPWRGLVV
jgi:hypothetical protein